MEILYLFLVIGAVAAVYFFFIHDKKKKPNSGSSGSGSGGSDPDDDDEWSGDVQGLTIRGVPKKFPFEYKTPRGISVGSVVAIPDQYQPLVWKALEYGAENCVNAKKAAFPSWSNGFDLSSHIVAFIHPHKDNNDGSPALMVLDQHQTAGTVIGVADPYPVPMIVLPHQGVTNWLHLVYLLYSMWNEDEHRIEFMNDRAVAMSFTGTQDQHQHHNLPADVPMLMMPAAQAVGFKMSPTQARCSFKLPDPVRGLVAKPQKIKVPDGTAALGGAGGNW